MSVAPKPQLSGLTHLSLARGRLKLWVGFTLTPQGLRRVVVERTRSKTLRALGPLGVTLADETRIRDLTDRFRAYARGEKRAFRGVKIDWAGTSEFAAHVLQVVRLIGVGAIMTYGEVASRVGSPRASRAVGRALATNPLPIVVPCHRVVGQGRRLGGFSMAHGLATKALLLAHEGLTGPWR
jgi:methylated-DNA-[protein]-cysteine S-methyltransferase